MASFTKMNGSLLGLAFAAVLLLGAGCGAPDKTGQQAELPTPPAPLPADLFSRDKAVTIVQDLVNADEDKDGLAAYLYPEVLRPGDEVSSWGGDPQQGGQPLAIAQYAYLAWIDREPGNIFYAHDTEFVVIDAKTGKTDRYPESFWPVVNGEPFEGSAETAVAGAPVSFRSGADLGARISGHIRDIAVPPARAAEDRRPRIAKDPADAPPGEYYALIISGYGMNAWVFLDGAWQMYDALKSAGYDDAHITFLAPGPVRTKEKWDRQGEPQVEKQPGSVDGYSGPKEVSAAIDKITKLMTDQDSLFVFVLAHGQADRIVLGRPMAEPQKFSLVRAFQGNEGSLSSTDLAEALLDKTQACEVMAVFDTCHAGSNKPRLEAAFKKSQVKRLAAAFATDAKSTAKGADYREPVDSKLAAWADLDKGKAPKTPTPDPNPEDLGGEFSSGIIASLDKQIFSAIYAGAIGLDAAKINKLTKPDQLRLGPEGVCKTIYYLIQPPEGTHIPPAGEPPAKPAEKIQAIPYDGSYITLDQVTRYTALQCKCCDADHWHAKSGSVKLLDGRTVKDPFANCGLGKVSEHPATTVDAP